VHYPIRVVLSIHPVDAWVLGFVLLAVCPLVGGAQVQFSELREGLEGPAEEGNPGAVVVLFCFMDIELLQP